jgi:hypothetical protein
MYVVKRDRVSGGCMLLKETESVADVCCYKRQSQWRMCVLGQAESVADVRC